MKRIKNNQILIKRIRLETNDYDFVRLEEKEANRIISNSRDLTSGMKYLKPNIFERTSFEMQSFFKAKKYDLLFSVLIILLTLFLENLLFS